MHIQWSKLLLIIGLLVLLVGAILSIMKVQPYSDYVLIAGVLLVILRGALRSRERMESKDENK